ncbi:mismatched base pair and cruciform dna recognition protein [Diplodia corticola]|uniref:Mismatched base pair and cruciform dna recognition protein n=1 Tax=Diplodia corticola TaxID=236234 RepID=A0A1J9R0N7_9PEZI|nr:mismatched base pair and cruciform dna recognition protein [Diplodia corticola]OJD34192.1 mismatched base pair and cruciform dna recognition protein [Diplodia corticola]
MSDKNTSTLQSYVDSATGAVQSAIGAVTGNTADKQQAEDKKAEAQAKDDLSHATAKAGPFTVSSSGVAKDDPNRTEGSWNQTVGSGKEMVGNLIGSESLKQEGVRQNQEGKGQEAQGQLSDLGSGISDRVGGAVGGAVAGITGNEKAKSDYEKQHDQGKTAQRGVEADLQKQADAQK